MNIFNYQKVRREAESYYSKLQPLECPALRETVFFSSHGFNHLIYKKERTERDSVSQITRFRLLSLAVRLISLTTTFQEYEGSMKHFWSKMYKEKKLLSKEVQYWGLIAIIDRKKIKVILRKVGAGYLHFWSVIPAWVTSKKRDQIYVSTMKGDPHED